MSKALASTAVAIALLTAVPCPADTGAQSPRAQQMQQRLDRRVRTVSHWQSQASQQIAFSLTIGLLGLVVGALQGSTKGWAKGLTVAGGLAVSAITLLTNKVYLADYRTMQRSVDQATPILEDLSEILATFDPSQTLQNQLAVEAEFKSKCGKIDQIGQKLLGVEPSQSPGAGTPQSAAWLSIPVVHASSPPPESREPLLREPGWVRAGQQSDKVSVYFVGEATDASLASAKTASQENAIVAAARWLTGTQAAQNTTQPSPQLRELLKNVAEVADTWFTYDPVAKAYHYYSRVRISNELKGLGLRNITITGSYKGAGPGWDRGMQTTMHCGNNPESWVRGSAVLDPLGRLLVTAQLETDSVTAGPKGRISVEFRDSSGKALATAMTNEIGIGGKLPGKALISDFSSSSDVPQDILGRTVSLYVDAQCTGGTARPFGNSFNVTVSAAK